jgi:formamidopyrimidine-DNA glycosylase
VPELPDVTVYVEALGRHVVGHRLEGVRLASASLLRSVEPPLATALGRRVTSAARLGKRIVLSLEGDLHLVLHLMIAGRLRWKRKGAALPAKRAHAAFDFEHGTLLLTEASPRKRATLHLVQGAAGLAAHDRGGLEVLEAGLPAFAAALARERHTLKRALTDPTLFSGIGNAYSDEILHRARLSPLQLTRNLDPPEVARLYDAAQATLREWTEHLRREVGDGFPEKVTAFREGMAVHGRHRQPCPDCGAPVQRIVRGESECNYCARCQTGGRLLADRALSRLLRDDWPRTLEELEARRPATAGEPAARRAP